LKEGDTVELCQLHNIDEEILDGDLMDYFAKKNDEPKRDRPMEKYIAHVNKAKLDGQGPKKVQFNLKDENHKIFSSL